MAMNSLMGWRQLALAWACVAIVAMPAQAAPPIDTLARIKAEGVIRVGVRNSAPPFAYYDANQKPAGFTWDLCRALVKIMEGELKRPIEIQPTPVSLPESFEMLKDGRIDLQCGS
ncbi:MAG: transporter substrate-binding domain-containing protein, partial [Comamonadaceae bacterium]